MREGHHSGFTGCARLAAAALAALLLAGCSGIGYYLQSVGGQLELWRLERPISTMLDDTATPESLRERLELVTRIRDFASRELGLPENRSYRGYADLRRQYVVWNVFAAPEFSVDPVRWCFPVAGCVSYRGYFSKEEADRFAQTLTAQGYDVHVRGVPAYSTLGWFPDPVLNTFVHYPEADLARLVFHELSHQLLYVKDDTAFNESFAVAVEQEGVRRWFASSGARAPAEPSHRARARAGFADLVHRHRARLDALYQSGIAPDAMRARKREILAEMRAEYDGLKAAWDGYSGYDRWFAAGPNNAQLASVSMYTRHVPAFEALLAGSGGDLAKFYRRVRELALKSRPERDAALAALAGSGDPQVVQTSAR